MAKNTKISVLSIRPDILKAPIGDYAAYEVQIKDYLKRNIDKVLPDNPDIIILPECCNRLISEKYPSDMARRTDAGEYYKYLGNCLVEYLAPIAKENNTNIAYSAVRYVPEDEKYPFRNSTIYIGRDGNICGIYDKNHLVIEENSLSNIAYGTEAKVIELDFGREYVGIVICWSMTLRKV